ncbi:hypothetical protein B446_31190 [Streptomyces collinus Tu 365]|uniref:Uncharacterized protein n=1 Tax=Streptomyces collinus (strain DSM 40733 / Tue 365) TaxID=1214242 RepID=S5VR06_STRC3|nr:hypothetical protein B446_31190 [Streptomyces collinus Tu 365]
MRREDEREDERGMETPLRNLSAEGGKEVFGTGGARRAGPVLTGAGGLRPDASVHGGATPHC